TRSPRSSRRTSSRPSRPTSTRAGSSSATACPRPRPARSSASSCAPDGYDARVLSIRGVRKSFGERVVLSAVTLEVAAGEYVAIVGESGIGKSTLLNIVAGLESPDAGEVHFEEKEINALADDARTLLRRDAFGFVFQAFHVLPHLTVEQNVGLPLLLRGQEKAAIERKATQLIAAVGLAGRENSMPR